MQKCALAQAMLDNITFIPPIAQDYFAFFACAKNGVQKKLEDFLFVLFFVRSKAKYQKKSRPAAWPKGSPRENHKHGFVTNSYPPAGLRHVTPCFRVYELRSATLQRVLKPYNIKSFKPIKENIRLLV